MTTLRRLAVVVAALGLIVSGIALPAAHAKGGRDGRGQQVQQSDGAGPAKGQQRGRSQAVNKGKRARFVVVGLVVGVTEATEAVEGTESTEPVEATGRTVTIDVKRGTKKLRGSQVTVAVPDDTIFHGGAWEDVRADSRIKVVGRRTDGEPVAWRVKIKRLAPPEPEDVDDLEDEPEEELEEELEDLDSDV